MVPCHRLLGWAWWLPALTWLVSLLAVGSAAFAADTKKPAPDLDPPMRFVVVRSNAAGCEPICPEWISAEGAITAKSPALLKGALKTLGSRKLPIVVSSPGGDVDAAIAMGRMISKNKLDIAVGKTWFVGCEPGVKNCRENDARGSHYIGNPYELGSYCASACPLMLAGGTRRLVGPLAYLGVHQITTTIVKMNVQYEVRYRIVKGKKRVISRKIVSRKNTGSYKTYEMNKTMERKLASYLEEMGVDQGVLETMKSTPASEIHQIDLDDMLTMRLVTSVDSVELLAAATVCNANPLPANCRDVSTGAKKAMPPAKAVTVEAKATPVAPVESGTVKQDGGGDMRFVLVRGSSFLCDPDCPEWISAEGTITLGTPERLRQLLDTIGDRRLPVVVSSPGGDVLGALATGRLIRERKLDVAVAGTDFVGCEPGEGDCKAQDGVYVGLTDDAVGACDSACAIMLAGGVRRLVGPQARLSVHSLGLEQKVRTYLEDMAVGPGLFVAMQSVLYSSHRQLEPDMMLKVGLTTGRQTVDDLTGAAICKSTPRPENCRVLPAPNAQADTPAKL